MRIKLSIIILALFSIGCNVRKKQVVEFQVVPEVIEAHLEHNNIEQYLNDRDPMKAINNDSLDIDTEHNEEMIDIRKGFTQSIKKGDDEKDESHDNTVFDLNKEERAKNRK